MAAVRAFAREPRPSGTAANTVARQWLLEELTRLTPDVEVQEGTVCDAFAGVVFCGHVQNVLARFSGTVTGSSFAFVAHYDSVFGSPGASDDGAGVAALLEVGHRVAASPHRNDVLLLFSDGEEDFLRGASLLSRHRWLKGVKGAVNFEARGVSGPSVLFFKGNDDEDLLLSIGRAFNPSASSALVRLARGLPNDSDATVLQRDGVPAIAFAFADGLEHYHRGSDSADNLSPASLAGHLDHSAVLVSHFANLVRPHPASGPKVFFDVFGTVLVSYPIWLAQALAIVLLGGLVLLLRSRTLREVWRSLGRLFLILGATSVFAILATAALLATRAQSRALSATVVLASLLLLLQLWSRSRGERAEALRAAVSLLWVVPAVFLGLFEPQLSYLFQWPVLALLVSELRWISGRGRRALRLLAAASVIVLWSWWAYTLLVAAGDAVAPAAMAALFGATLVEGALGGGGRRVLAVAFAVGACITLATFSKSVREVHDPEGLLRKVDSAELRRVTWNPQVDPWALRLEDRGPASIARDLPLPTLVTERIPSARPTLRMTLLAKSQRGSSHLVVWELSGAKLRAISVNGEPVGEIVRFSPSIDRWLWLHLSGDHDTWRLQFAGLPAEGARIEIELAANAIPVFEVRDELSEGEPSRTLPGIAASFSSIVARP